MTATMDELKRRQFSEVQPAAQIVIDAAHEQGHPSVETQADVTKAANLICSITESEARSNQKAVDYHFVKLSSLVRSAPPEATPEHSSDLANQPAQYEDPETQMTKLI